ncbi:T9SS type A sorting domain-containing protein, partial [Nonlabens mediterrranea]|nr:T9SS type A sorting domain-containing protein [Nonlabens mediterrranea]
ELYNNSSSTLSLDNLYLSDDATDPLMWQFPSGITIAPDSYLIVWCDKDLNQTGLHADLKFSSNGEDAVLSYDNGTVIESITFGAQTTDMGYARVPNGTGNFVIQAPTFGTNNETLSNSDFERNTDYSIYPNPVNDVININTNNGSIDQIALYNLQGQQLMSLKLNGEQQSQLDLTNYTQGIYLLTINNQQTVKVIKQ